MTTKLYIHVKLFTTILLIFNSLFVLGQNTNAIDLSNWKLELPSGYSIAPPAILNFQDDTQVQPFLSRGNDGSLIFKAFPTEATQVGY